VAVVGVSGLRKLGVIAVFLGPSLVALLAFSIGPMLGTVWVSFQDWNLIRDARFIGLDNYRELWGDDDFRRALKNTVYYLVGYLPLVTAGGLGLALLINHKMRGIAFFRAIYFLPVVTSWVVVALLWKWLLNPSDGLINWLLGLVGIDGPGWWTSRTWAMPSVILASAWKDLGFVMIILLAGLQSIDETLYEAARIDGANAWRQLRSITLPMLTPSLFFVTVISLINGFQVFDQVWVMTNGGPAGSSSVVVEQIVKNTFSYGRAGYASAQSVALFLIILIVTAVQMRFQKRWVFYG
jgi:multiple sugar transport system permease protein